MALKASALKVGDTHSERVVENLSRTQIVQYAGASGDYNPLHTDEVYTTQIAGYPSVFAHGMLTMGLTGKMLTNYVGDGTLTKFGVRFTNQVWPGDTLDVKGNRGGRAGRRGPALRRSDTIHHQPGRQGSGRRIGNRAHRSIRFLSWQGSRSPAMTGNADSGSHQRPVKAAADPVAPLEI